MFNTLPHFKFAPWPVICQIPYSHPPHTFLTPLGKIWVLLINDCRLGVNWGKFQGHNLYGFIRVVKQYETTFGKIMGRTSNSTWILGHLWFMEETSCGISGLHGQIERTSDDVFAQFSKYIPIPPPRDIFFILFTYFILFINYHWT